MRNFTIFLTLLLLFVVGGVRADVITTKPLPGVEYKIKCIATDHNGYLGDDGNTLQGRHATGTIQERNRQPFLASKPASFAQPSRERYR